MLVKTIGEFALIERFIRKIKLSASVVRGPGDDCAVLKYNRTHYQLFTCDTIVEQVDFRPEDDPRLVGRKAIAVCLSDIASCGGIPRYCLVSMVVPKNTRLNYLDNCFKGMLSLCKEYKLDLVGGDLSAGNRLCINVSILGIVEKKRLVLRNTAKPGDILFVTGTLGGSIKGRHFRFTPRIKEARFLSKNFRINSMIDISDGLVSDLWHIIRQSRVGATLYAELIPIDKQADGLNNALYDGEDFELIFSACLKEARRIIRQDLKWVSPIGELRRKAVGLSILDRQNREKTLKPKGFRHF